MSNRIKRGKTRFPISYFSACVYICRICEWPNNVLYTSFLTSTWKIFPKGQLQWENSSAHMSRQYDLQLCTIGLIQYRAPSLTAGSLKEIDDVDGSHKSSDLHTNFWQYHMYRRMLQFKVSVSWVHKRMSIGMSDLEVTQNSFCSWQRTRVEEEHHFLNLFSTQHPRIHSFSHIPYIEITLIALPIMHWVPAVCWTLYKTLQKTISS